MAQRSLIWFLGVVAVGLFARLSAAPLPFAAADQHLGVATCAGSNCHGARQAFDSSAVLQNEYFTWQQHDAHANAFNLLRSDEGQAIARKLGHGSAETATECLTCHSDFVPAAQRGPRFRLSDGVGCEACHGGAERWLGPHVAGASHAQNLATGLYPLERPLDRARLCLHCHQGSAEKPIDHRIMGAGHPPLVFELDTFTAIQPAHFAVDADYRQRKGASGGFETWAAGQVLAARFYLEGLLSERFSPQGLTPELVFFDCNACHHNMRNIRWTAGTSGGLPPGRLRLNEAHLGMVDVVVAVAAAPAAQDWADGVQKLRSASQESLGAIQRAARDLLAVTVALESTLTGGEWDQQQIRQGISRIAQNIADGRAGDFTTAEQASMALGALSEELIRRGAAAAPLRAAMDPVYAALASRDNYNASAFAAAVAKLSAATKG